MEEVIDRLDWASVRTQLDQEGHAVLPGFLDESQVSELAALLRSESSDRQASLVPEGLGRGALVYLPRALPPLLADLRALFYRHLAPIADVWGERLGLSHRYPDSLELFLGQNRRAGQVRPQSNLSLLREDDYQALHQRNDDEHVFPLQLVALLSEPGKDFDGGEFVMTEQRPRMQSRPMVLPLRKGDMAVIAVAQRPHKGTKGYYRVNLKHAVSRVRSGERIGLEILFHDTRQG